jgi:hypothetical protein
MPFYSENRLLASSYLFARRFISWATIARISVKSYMGDLYEYMLRKHNLVKLGPKVSRILHEDLSTFNCYR